MSYVKGASAATRNKGNLLADAFEIDVERIDGSGTPNDFFDEVVAAVGEQHREQIENLVRKAFRLGIRRGAIVATDAIIDGKIDFDDSTGSPVLTANETHLQIGKRTLTFGANVSVEVDRIKLPVSAIGFD